MDFGSSASRSFDSFSPSAGGLGSSLPSSPPAGGDNAADKELQEFIMIEQQRAQLQAQVHKLNDVCWDKCIDKPSAKLDARQDSCLSNCADRFVDVSLAITTRFSQLIQKQRGVM